MPSILSADFANLQTAIESVPSSDAIHVDVMDNHFVPNLTLGLPVVESIRKITDKILDIHLMIEQPDRWAPGTRMLERNRSPFTWRPLPHRCG